MRPATSSTSILRRSALRRHGPITSSVRRLSAPLGRQGYRHECLVLVLVAVAALSTVNLVGPQDRTRYELARHVVLHHSLTIEPGLFDSAVFDGRSYSDKAPGISALLVPAYEAERLMGIARAPRDWQSEGDLSLWLLRVVTSGMLFMCTVFIVGRVAENLAPATGAAAAATFGTATLASPLAPTLFEHDAAAAFAFAAFVLAWRARRTRELVLAGLCAGLAVFFSYVALLVALFVAAYCARQGARRLGAFVLGAVPPAVRIGGLRLGCVRISVSPLVSLRREPVRRASAPRLLRDRRSHAVGAPRGARG